MFFFQSLRLGSTNLAGQPEPERRASERGGTALCLPAQPLANFFFFSLSLKLEGKKKKFAVSCYAAGSAFPSVFCALAKAMPGPLALL
jgi:hypothetical protein